jgi:3' terminal RNA ribose 2'-O-methyltransferase Hen1
MGSLEWRPPGRVAHKCFAFIEGRPVSWAAFFVTTPASPTMILTISTTHQPATDPGYLLAKNPARCQSFDLAFGKAHVFYPRAGSDCCTAALMLDLDPVGLVRGRSDTQEGALDQYVNDRPYVASSFLSVAIAQVFGAALNGRSRERQELADSAIPLTARIAVVPCRGGEGFLRRLFEPLGYEVQATPIELDARFPDWGPSVYFDVTLTATKCLAELLSHLYVLLPVLDKDKHYWVGQDELEKLLAKGEGWLAAHPERDQITRRYLRGLARLTRQAIERLTEEDQPDPIETEQQQMANEDSLEARVSLNDERLGSVVAALKAAGAKRVLDVGCGEGNLLRLLLADKHFELVAGMDVSPRSLEKAADRLRLERMNERQQSRLALFQGSLVYRDARLAGYDAICAVEVIEHVDPSRLGALERVVFEFSASPTIIVTTPNAEYNTRFEILPAGKFRHGDHRFEWRRDEFEVWATRTGQRFGYAVRFAPIGPVDQQLGAPTQMAVFSK